LVIEEAHRLLENTRSSGNQESADMKGKAVETFNNMLSEIRAYGQGLIVADQIPTKLSPDILKNTNLKMIHKLYAKDDRQMISDSIGLTEEQMSELIRLQQGEAVIFHGQVDAPIKVKIHADRSILAEDQSDTRRLEKTPIHLENYLLQNDSFRDTCFRLINTFILFPEAELKINELLRKEVQSLLFNAAVSEALISNLWLKGIQMYYKEKRVFEKVAYPL
ncbi:ATP-binding protein, partial [Mycobacterium tuberculosis]